MDEDIQIFSLDLPGFAIEFDVKKKESIAFTHRFGAHSEAYVFAVADIWVRVKQVRYLIVPERHPGNLIELLKGVEIRLRNPEMLEGVETFLPRGHWGEWMHGYWERLMNDSPAADDETLYGRLIPLSLVDGKGGHVVAYRYNGLPTIEIATRRLSKETPVSVWSAFTPELLARQVHELREAISMHVGDAMREA